jgi:hypothetical protein
VWVRVRREIVIIPDRENIRKEKQKGRWPINTVAGLTPVVWASSEDAVVEEVAMSHDHSLGLVQATWCGGLCM